MSKKCQILLVAMGHDDDSIVGGDGRVEGGGDRKKIVRRSNMTKLKIFSETEWWESAESVEAW